MIYPLHGNSWEELKHFKDRYFDCIITDPMYDAPFHLTELQRVCRGNIVVFCKPENEFFAPDERAYWIKPPSTKNFSKHLGRFVEHILIKRPKNATFNAGMYWANYTGVYFDVIEGKKLHEFQKPLALVERLMRIYSNPGDMILDPFMGSGTTLLAAENLGRSAYGYDLELVNVQVSRKRLRHLGELSWGIDC